MIAAAWFASCTAGSWITIWFGALLADLGLGDAELVDAVPHDVDRAVEIVGVSSWPRGGCAWSTTSRPPWRSRPLRSVLVDRRARNREQRNADERRDEQPDQDEVRAARRQS